MALPPDLQFSQGSLQDFVDCQRRFQLRHLLQLAWPAVEAEPIAAHERALQLGSRFHRLVQQHLLGLPVERLSQMIDDDELGHWWRNYLDQTPASLPGRRFPEVTLTAPLGVFRLVAKMDLVIVDADGRAQIFDWKTSQRRPSRRWLAERLQTRVYPFLLARAGAGLPGLNGQAPGPDQIEMIYWFAAFPGQPERFPYSREAYESDARALNGLAEEIIGLARTTEEFPLTLHEERCRFCIYRSLCGRGVVAGSALEVDDPFLADVQPEFDIDFEQIAEIEW